MSTKKFKAYGSWDSPVTSTSITTDAVQLDEVQLFGSDAYWLEKRPTEKGRCVIVRYSSGQIEDVLPAPFSARSRVHEYGGGVYCISDNAIYFVNDTDQQIYFFKENESPVAITQNPEQKYADLVFDHHRNKIICVCQQETDKSEPDNFLVSININTGAVETLCSGYDFYSNPRVSPDGKQLSWLCWNHPDMPWDSTELWLSDIDMDSQLSHQNKITGGDNVSIFQPEWSPAGALTFVSDRTGWWNLYQHTGQNITTLTNEHAEFGLPQWVFRQSTYAFINDNEIVCSIIKQGIARLHTLNTVDHSLKHIETPWNSFHSVHSANGSYWFIAASSESFPELVSFDHKNTQTLHVRSSRTTSIDTDYFSYADTYEIPTRHGVNTYAFYYAPKNKLYTANENERPPLIVLSHGGPTGMSDPSLDMRKQFWTSRGFAILDVNYSGSTGFGRDYRERLQNNWGIRDAQDCCDAALHMVKLGLADHNRLIIKGSSAGGYTVLCALTFHDVFTAGASYYGIGDLESLLRDTHKFEARYLDRLVGPYPESRCRYIERSPLQHVESLNCPVIFFQGLEDRVVPKEQAVKMFNALNKKGIPVAYVAFEGEQHGFRKAETIEKTLNAELYFYAQVFNLPVDHQADISINNLND